MLRDLRTRAARRWSRRRVCGAARSELVTMPSPGIEPLSTLTRRFPAAPRASRSTPRAAFTPDEVVDKVRQGACELGLLGASGAGVRPGHRRPAARGAAVRARRRPRRGVPGRATPSRTPPVRRPHDRAPAGSLMRQIVDDLARRRAPRMQIVAEVAHRTSILPLVLQGVGLAVLPSAWAPLARRAGAASRASSRPPHLQVALVSRTAPLTPAAQAFLAWLDRRRTGTVDRHCAAPG